MEDEDQYQLCAPPTTVPTVAPGPTTVPTRSPWTHHSAHRAPRTHHASISIVPPGPTTSPYPPCSQGPPRPHLHRAPGTHHASLHVHCALWGPRCQAGWSVGVHFLSLCTDRQIGGRERGFGVYREAASALAGLQATVVHSPLLPPQQPWDAAADSGNPRHRGGCSNIAEGVPQAALPTAPSHEFRDSSSISIRVAVASPSQAPGYLAQGCAVARGRAPAAGSKEADLAWTIRVAVGSQGWKGFLEGTPGSVWETGKKGHSEHHQGLLGGPGHPQSQDRQVGQGLGSSFAALSHCMAPVLPVPGLLASPGATERRQHQTLQEPPVLPSVGQGQCQPHRHCLCCAGHRAGHLQGSAPVAALIMDNSQADGGHLGGLQGLGAVPDHLGPNLSALSWKTS